MADSQGSFAALSPKQKMMMFIFLMIAVFILWEVIGLFRGAKAASPPAVAATAPLSKPALPQAPPPAVQQAASRPSVLTPQQSRPKMEMAPPSSIIVMQQDQVQTKYVSALNELQMLKIQKEIAETSQAIVAAKLATATAEKSITDLLSEATTSSTKAAPTSSSTVVTPLPAPLPKAIGNGYTVQSVSMEQDQWHAVVKYKNKLYAVGVGDLLPPDQSLVKVIDQSGIVIENAGLELRIPLTMTDNEGASAATGSTAGPS